MENFIQDRIDAYIRGEMSASERAAFSKDLSQNDELRKDYEFTKNVANTISDRERKKQQIRNWNQNKHKTVYLYSTITSIAAVLIVGFFFFRNTSSENSIVTISEDNSVLSSDNYYSYTEIGQLIAEQNYSAALQHIENAENNDYSIDDSTAITDIVSSETVEESSYELKWFKAQALLGLNRIEEARALLKEISNSNSRYKEMADSLLVELQYNKVYN